MAMNSKDPRAQKGILIALGVGAIVYVDFFTTWLPFTYKAGSAQAAALEAQYLEASKNLNKARSAAHSLPYLEKEDQLLERKWSESQSVLPEHEDMASLLRTITLLGTQAGVDFTLFRPAAPKPAQYHTENPIDVQVVGGYHQVGRFLGDMANLSRLLIVGDLEIIPNKDKVKDKPAEAHFTVSTYTLGGTGVPADAGNESKGAKTGKSDAGAKTGKDTGGKSPARGATGGKTSSATGVHGVGGE